jgi:hypothetical protein
LHVLSNLRAKQSIAPAKPTVHIAYTMKIGHAFEVSIVEVESFLIIMVMLKLHQSGYTL